MSRSTSMVTPATVAPVPGYEADKLLQRFAVLDPHNRSRLLESALSMIEHQHNARLPAREREARRVIQTVERTVELLHMHGHEDRIQTAMWREMLSDGRRRLAAFGIDYYGPAGADPT